MYWPSCTITACSGLTRQSKFFLVNYVLVLALFNPWCRAVAVSDSRAIYVLFGFANCVLLLPLNWLVSDGGIGDFLFVDMVVIGWFLVCQFWHLYHKHAWMAFMLFCSSAFLSASFSSPSSSWRKNKATEIAITLTQFFLRDLSWSFAFLWLLTFSQSAIYSKPVPTSLSQVIFNRRVSRNL